jgi:AcrR family transcriptional regulator
MARAESSNETERTPSGTVSRMTRPQRRRQVLDVAAKIVAEGGASDLTMERLAKEAGVTKPIVYDHFENSNAVLAALLEEGFTDAETEIDHVVLEDLPMEERMRQVAHIAFAAISANPAALVLVANQISDPELEARRQELRDGRVKKAAMVWETELDLADAELVMQMLFAAAEEAGRQFVRSDRHREVFERILGDMFTAVLGSESHSPR